MTTSTFQPEIASAASVKIPGRLLASYIVSAASLIFGGMILVFWVKGIHMHWASVAPFAGAVTAAPVLALTGFGLGLGYRRSSWPAIGRVLVSGALALSVLAIGLAAADSVYFVINLGH